MKIASVKLISTIVSVQKLLYLTDKFHLFTDRTTNDICFNKISQLPRSKIVDLFLLVLISLTSLWWHKTEVDRVKWADCVYQFCFAKQNYLKPEQAFWTWPHYPMFFDMRSIREWFRPKTFALSKTLFYDIR